MKQKLFLIDGFGAVISAFMLGVVLINFQDLIGLPANILYVLSIIPCFFAIYSFSCHFLSPKNWKLYLKIIAFLNLSYILLTLSIVIINFEKISFLGMLYFILEIIIVGYIVNLELKTAAILNKHN